MKKIIICFATVLFLSGCAAKETPLEKKQKSGDVFLNKTNADLEKCDGGTASEQNSYTFSCAIDTTNRVYVELGFNENYEVNSTLIENHTLDVDNLQETTNFMNDYYTSSLFELEVPRNDISEIEKLKYNLDTTFIDEKELDDYSFSVSYSSPVYNSGTDGYVTVFNLPSYDSDDTIDTDNQPLISLGYYSLYIKIK